jgi:hypothetical protein
MPAFCPQWTYSVCNRIFHVRNQGASPLALLALLLLAAPEVLTLQKFVALLALGDDNHQLAEPPSGIINRT